MKPLSSSRMTPLQPSGSTGIAQMPPAHLANGRWDLGAGSFKLAANTHSAARGLVSDVCPEMSALPPDQCAGKLVADARLALREIDIDVS